MAYIIEFSTQYEKSIKKLKKKDKVLFDQIQKKLLDLIRNPDRYRTLGNVLSGYRRLHFGSFVLIYKIEKNVVRSISLDHHDKPY